MNQIVLCFLSDDPSNIKLAELYWSLEIDGSWTHNVKEFADYLRIPASQVSLKVASIAEAYIVDCRCVVCGSPQIVKSRSDLSKITVTGQLCGTCAALQKKRDEERTLLVKREEQNRKNTIWLRETSYDGTFDYRSMGYTDAFYAFVLLVNSEFDEATGEIVLPSPQAFSPDPDALLRSIIELHKKGVLLFGKKTPLDAFVVDEKTSDSFKYYPNKVSWRFALPSWDDSFDSLLSELSDVIDSKEERDDYLQTIEDLWWQIAQAEAKRYLDVQLDVYGLSIEDGDKLRQALKYLLQHFSIPQTRNLIWRAAKDTAAYAARRDVHRRQAINSIPGILIRICDRAIADHWTINPYVLKWDEEESLVTTMLFDRVLRTGTTGFKSLSGRTLSALSLPA